MFDRFEEPARRVMSASRQAALDLGHDAIGPEHILVALIEEGGAVGEAMIAAGVTGDAVRREIAAVSGPRGAAPWTGQLPFMPLSKTVLERALDAAEERGHAHISTAHLFIGVLRASAKRRWFPRRDNVVGTVFERLGVAEDELREQALALVDGVS